MKTRHGMGIGLVGLLLSTVAFAEAPAASDGTEEITVAAASVEPVIEEIIVKARRPDAGPQIPATALYDPAELLDAMPIEAPELSDEMLFKPEIRLDL